MARVYFMRNFDYKPTPQRLYAYKAGQEYTVKRECADQAIAGGYGVEEKPPRRRKKADVG